MLVNENSNHSRIGNYRRMKYQYHVSFPASFVLGIFLAATLSICADLVSVLDIISFPWVVARYFVSRPEIRVCKLKQVDSSIKLVSN